MQIKLGPGCPECHAVGTPVRGALAGANVSTEVADGAVKRPGRMPAKKELPGWLG